MSAPDTASRSTRPLMPDWRTHLTPDEARIMAENKQTRASTRKEDRKIYDRARKRAKRVEE
jgi:hypothetical protein